MDVKWSSLRQLYLPLSFIFFMLIKITYSVTRALSTPFID